MHDIPSIITALLLIVTSAALLTWHVRGRQFQRVEEMDARERDFRRRQFRRRVQTSALIGVLGVAIFVGQLLLDAKLPQRFQVVYWIGVLALVLWIALLAVADMVATSFYFSREKTNFVVQHAKLQAELRKARNEDARIKSNGHNGNGNGKAGGH